MYLLDGYIVAIPEVLPVFEGGEMMDIIKNKSISRFGDDVEYSCDFIMTDCALIDDLSCIDCYLFLLASRDQIMDKNLEYWSPDFNLVNMDFLGWTIADYNGGSYAFCDGVFPIQGREAGGLDVYELKVFDKGVINEWGLIKNDSSLEEYMNRNKENSTACMEVNGDLKKIKIDWKAFGVFCDKFTLAKLVELQKSMDR